MLVDSTLEEARQRLQELLADLVQRPEVTGGLAEESMSSRSARAEGNRKLWGRITRPVIDAAAALLGDRGHCERAYKSDRNKPALPLIGGAR